MSSHHHTPHSSKTSNHMAVEVEGEADVGVAAVEAEAAEVKAAAEEVPSRSHRVSTQAIA